MSEKAQNQEIEITPEMVEAGYAVYASLSEAEELGERIVREVYVEMERSRRQPLYQGR